MSKIGETIRDGVKGIHGAGEAIRGEINSATSAALGVKQEEVENKAVANKGFADMKRADETIGHKNGIDGAHNTTATGTGVHSTAPGNIGATGATGATNARVQEQPGTTQRF